MFNVSPNIICFCFYTLQIYESDAFFEIADELGILIWQDFMFACAMYPADEPFLRTVSEEITHQVRINLIRPIIQFKETKSATNNCFRKKNLFKSFVKAELSCFYNKSVHCSYKLH